MIYDDEPLLNFNLNSYSQVRMQLKTVELANKTYSRVCPDTVIRKKPSVDRVGTELRSDAGKFRAIDVLIRERVEGG